MHRNCTEIAPLFSPAILTGFQQIQGLASPPPAKKGGRGGESYGTSLGPALALALAVFGTLASADARAASALPTLTGTITRNAGTIGGWNRSYALYVPRDLKPGAPLLFMFHGGGGDGPLARESTGREYDMLADRFGFVVVYPDGIGKSWTGCRKEQNRTSTRGKVDDIGFVEAIIAQEVATHGIDRSRVFATGHSMGGQFSYRLALERPHEFAAIAAVSSNLPTSDNMGCEPQNVPMPVLIMNGTADPVSPYNGGSNGRTTGKSMSSDDTAQYFAKLNGLADMPATERLPHLDPSDRTSVDRMSWTAPGKPSVVLYRINGGGHLVPQPYYRYPRVVGTMTEDVDAPTVIWEFFSKAPAR